MSALRILHVTPYSPAAWGYGGIPRVVGAFTEELKRRGHRVTVLTTDARDAVSRLPQGEGICPNLSNHLAYRHQLFLPLGMLAALRRLAPEHDIAHLHACHNLPSVFAARELHRAGVPWVLGPNGTAPRIERRIAAKRLFDALFGRDDLHRAARVLATSRAEELQLDALGVTTERIARMPNPVDVAEIDGRPERGVFRRRYGLGDDPLVVYLGKLTPRKRLDVLIDAFARLHLSARLVIAGGDMGVEWALRRRAWARGVEVLFTGLLTGTERFGALVDADVVVYPSEHEIFGLVPLEALLCGAPVIVADDSGCGEIIGEVGGGRVVPLGDVAALATEIEAVLCDPEVREEAAHAAERVRLFYGTESVVYRLEKIYREVLDG